MKNRSMDTVARNLAAAARPAGAPSSGPNADGNPPVRSALRRNGSLDVTRIGLKRNVWTDLYHSLLKTSWPGIFALLTGTYVLVNSVFAALYAAGGACIQNARPGSFVDAFQFSVQTFATIGYGVYAPITPWAHGLVAIEALVGIVFGAMATGLMFAKFARPTARVIFAERAPISNRDGVPTLQFRIANGRMNQLVEASVKIRISRNEITMEGERIRRFHDVKLVRDTNPIFALTWTIFHPIDADSLLFGATPESLAAVDAMLILIVTGTDETMGQTVHARGVYMHDQIIWNHRFVDIVTRGENGGLVIDYTHFHDLEAVATPIDDSARG